MKVAVIGSVIRSCGGRCSYCKETNKPCKDCLVCILNGLVLLGE